MTKKFAKKFEKIFSIFKSKGAGPKLPIHRKMVIVGDGECGKTCLVTRMCTGDFVDVGYLPTVFETDVISVRTGNEEVDLTIFDSAGQEDYDRLRSFSYIDVDVAIVCFNLVDTDTLTNVNEKWVPEIRNFCGNVPIILVGNKKDLRDPSIPSVSGASSYSISEHSDSTSSGCAQYKHSSDGEQHSTENERWSSENDDEEEDCRHSVLIAPSPIFSARIPFHVQAPVKHSEGASIAKRIGAIAYFETSALSGDNVEELLLAATKASVLGSKKSRTYRPFLGTLKSWKSVKGLEHLSKRGI